MTLMQGRLDAGKAAPGGALALLAWFMLCLAGLSNAATAAETVAKDARVGGDIQRTRFVADLSKEVDFRLFTLADPYRLIIDLPNVKFQLPAGLGDEGRGLVQAYRYGLVAEGKARIVIDLTEPALIDKAFVLPPRDQQPARLVIDLIRTNRASFLSAMETRERRAPESKGEGESESRIPLAMTPKTGKPVVVIDPGHGGIDPGAVSGSGVKEKDIVFNFSRELSERLEKSGRYKVLMTRTIDTYIALHDRVEFARKNNASLFISIHADSLPGRHANKVSGATVYTLSERASDSEARALAAKENLSDVLAGVELPEKEDEVTGILIDLALRETKNLSITFADFVLGSLKGKTPLMKRAHRFAGFRVLKAPDVPSVLIELGYMTNRGDIKNMMSDKWRARVAKSLLASVDRFFAARSRGPRVDRLPQRSSAAR